MEVAALLVTHAIAGQTRKTPFFLSRFDFERMKQLGNTHYCFHCGGRWGFKMGKAGIAHNCEEPVATLHNIETSLAMKVSEVIADPELEPHIADELGYARRTPDHHLYKEWLNGTAYFTPNPELAEIASRRGYRFRRSNPMKNHDPKTHADGVVGQGHRYGNVWEWIARTKYPKGFPFVVQVD